MAALDPRARAIARVIWDAENGDGDYDRACRQIPGTMSMPGLALNITARNCLTALREAIPGLDALIAGMGVVASEAATLEMLAKRFAAKAEAHDAAARLILEKALIIERQQGVRPRKKYEAKAREERLAKMDRMVERELRAMIEAAKGE